ncbi:hypothetical protein Q7P37_011643 [Cladosporium fusiforme]
MMTTRPWTRFVRFCDTKGRELCGEPEDPNVDVGIAVATGAPVRVKVLSNSSVLEEGDFTGEVVELSKVGGTDVLYPSVQSLITSLQVLSPLSKQEVGTIRCIGLNFKDHAAELNFALPQFPDVFFKPAECLNDPCDPIIIPTSAPEALDAEVELAIIIGKPCKNVDATAAMDYILGYTTANDVTARDVQARVSQWGYSKGYDGFCPVGPVIVNKDASGFDVNGLAMTTKLNDEILQNGSSSQMIFTVGEIVSYLSQDTTLPAGSVIITGTPCGIGHSYSPPKYLKPGCKLEVTISGGLGSLVNTVVGADGQR